MSVKTKMQEWLNTLSGLVTYANGVTGESDTNIGDAVRTLADGYGQGGGLADGIYSIETFDHQEDWTTDEYGNTLNFFNTYMSTTRPSIAVVSNNTWDGSYKANCVWSFMSSNGSPTTTSPLSGAYRANWTQTRSITATNSFYLAAGSKITVITFKYKND